ncbi:MAG: hypothetical protein ACYDD5_09675 [Sulfuricurvum sp.]
MIDSNGDIFFNTLANEIGVDLKHLPFLFSALKVDTDRIFPLLEKEIYLNDFSMMHYHTDALKGIAGNMRLYDIYELITVMDCATIRKDHAFLYLNTLTVIKLQIDLLIEQFYAYINKSNPKQ